MSSSLSSARIIQVNVNPKGGVPKYGVAEALVSATGVAGDKQRDRRYHGGPTRAVSLYGYERILALQGEGHPIAPGTTGENLTIAGLDWGRLQVGDCLRIGDDVCIVITEYAVPCKNIIGSFSDGKFSRMSQKLHPGWSRLYARVLSEGVVRPGDAVAFDIGDF